MLVNLTSSEKVIIHVDGHGWTRRLARKYKAAKNRYSRFCDKHGFVIPPSFASTKAEKKVQGKAFELWKSQDKAWMRLNKFCRNLRIKYGLKYGASESEVLDTWFERRRASARRKLVRHV